LKLKPDQELQSLSVSFVKQCSVVDSRDFNNWFSFKCKS